MDVTRNQTNANKTRKKRKKNGKRYTIKKIQIIYFISIGFPALAESNQQINESKKKNTKSYVKKEHTISETSIKEWLKMNSLAALKLRILDALGPVVVKQSATHIGILDKYVTSKVWNDVSLKLIIFYYLVFYENKKKVRK